MKLLQQEMLTDFGDLTGARHDTTGISNGVLEEFLQEIILVQML